MEHVPAVKKKPGNRARNPTLRPHALDPLWAPTLYSRLHNLNLQLPSASCGHLDLLFTCVRSAILPKLEPTGKLQHPCCSCSMLQGEHWEDEAALKELHARPPLHLNCKLMMPTIIDVHRVRSHGSSVCAFRFPRQRGPGRVDMDVDS